VYAVSFVLIRTLSRYREFAADRGAAVLTKSPSSLASALVKISGAMGRIPQKDLRMTEGLNQFFIIPANVKSGISNMFSTHPTLDARLEQLRRLEREIEAL
jgi:heat shock protein HtpX